MLYVEGNGLEMCTFFIQGILENIYRIHAFRINPILKQSRGHNSLCTTRIKNKLSVLALN